MSDTKYVYKEVVGRDLEKVTRDGWEYVSNGVQMTPFSTVGIYVVRRPFQMSTVMELQEQLDEMKTALENSKTEQARLSSRLDSVRAIVMNLADEAAKTGRNKHTRDDLVYLIQRLVRDICG